MNKKELINKLINLVKKYNLIELNGFFVYSGEYNTRHTMDIIKLYGDYVIIAIWYRHVKLIEIYIYKNNHKIVYENNEMLNILLKNRRIINKLINDIEREIKLDILNDMGEKI